MWQAKLKATLEEISKHYVPGCIPYYESKDPNLWQEELDHLESAMRTGDEVVIKNALDLYVANCKLLIRNFQK